MLIMEEEPSQAQILQRQLAKYEVHTPDKRRTISARNVFNRQRQSHAP
jgi:hypothetical protein